MSEPLQKNKNKTGKKYKTITKGQNDYYMHLWLKTMVENAGVDLTGEIECKMSKLKWLKDYILSKN